MPGAHRRDEANDSKRKCLKVLPQKPGNRKTATAKNGLARQRSWNLDCTVGYRESVDQVFSRGTSLRFGPEVKLLNNLSLNTTCRTGVAEHRGPGARKNFP